MLNKEIILTIEDLTMAYGDQPVLWDNDLNIPKGSRTAIIGPNGAGKSTLIKGILGLEKRLSGHVKIFGEEGKKVRQRISYIPQSSSVNWNFPTTVLDVVLMGRYVRLGWIRRPGKSDRKAALEALRYMGMANYQNRQISELSGGQKQRVFLARTMVSDAEVYFMDEPLAGVDQRTEKVIMDYLKEQQKKGKTSVVIHHDLNTVKDYFDYVVLLNKVVIAEGWVEDVFTPTNLKKAYGEK